MGTRNLTKVIDSTGRTRAAQYGQWDGYPSYTGTRILDFITERGNLERIQTNLKKVHFITDDEVDSFYEGFTDGDSFESVYPTLSRNTGCDILRVIAYSSGFTLPLVDNSEFENDELFCEGVYTLNYETREFVSVYGDKTIKFSFDQLPTADEYLRSFEKDLTIAA